MGIILAHGGLGYKGVSFTSNDFDTPLFRCTYSINVNESFNGKYINNQYPPQLYKVGQVTLLAGNSVVYHEFINFLSRDLGYFSAATNYRQPINIYRFPYCLSENTKPPGSPKFYEYFASRKVGGDNYFDTMGSIYRARYPDATDDEIQAMINCDIHMNIGEINPVKLGMLRFVNTVKVELFSPGVQILLLLLDE
ncbi:hypothetical protein [Vibrio sp.]|uniref:hypothetical protein n=1 Tax=Vibrio sp. TaxID=678 RepID=UPI003D0DC7BA